MLVSRDQKEKRLCLAVICCGCRDHEYCPLLIVFISNFNMPFFSILFLHEITKSSHSWHECIVRLTFPTSGDCNGLFFLEGIDMGPSKKCYPYGYLNMFTTISNYLLGLTAQRVLPVRRRRAGLPEVLAC